MIAVGEGKASRGGQNCNRNARFKQELRSVRARSVKPEQLRAEGSTSEDNFADVVASRAFISRYDQVSQFYDFDFIGQLVAQARNVTFAEGGFRGDKGSRILAAIVPA